MTEEDYYQEIAHLRELVAQTTDEMITGAAVNSALKNRIQRALDALAQEGPSGVWVQRAQKILKGSNMEEVIRKAANTNSIPTREDIQLLGQVDPVVQAVLNLMPSERLSWVDRMMILVRVLVEQNKNLQDKLLKIELEKPLPRVFSLEGK